MLAEAIPMIETHQQILEHMNTAVLMCDQHMVLQYINPAGEMLFEHSTRQLLGRSLAELINTDQAFIEQIQEALDSSHPFSKHEIIITLPEAKELTVDLTVNVVHETNAPPELLLEIKPVDRLQRISRDEFLVAQQNATRELLRGLAHEVKNPLGGLRGAAQLLEKQLDDDELKEYTQVIIDEADRLQKLVNRILGPAGVPVKVAVNIHELLERVRSLVTIESTDDIVIRRDYDPSIPDILGDADQLIQAILNIVKNAKQALGTTGNIILRTRVHRKFTLAQIQHKLVARIDIIDDGPGVPEKIREKLFFPMITGRANGTGLGLSIAQTLIQQHNGMIECDSQPGNTMFSIFLPIAMYKED